MQYNKNKQKISDETALYYVGWCLITMFIAYVVINKMLNRSGIHPIYPCMLHTLTGAYCPGCGGTRAVYALLNGKIIISFLYHPIVLYSATVGGWFMLSQSIERITGGKLHIGMRFRTIYLWLALTIVVINCAVRNIALFIFHIPTL